MDEVDPQLKAQFDAWMVLEREKQQMKDQASLDLTRKMRIEQIKGRFKDPADKRAIGNLTDLRFDCEEFETKFLKLVNPDQSLVDLKDNMEEVQSFLRFCALFGTKMIRKLKDEIECYEIANRSPHGWAAVKYFHEEDIFDSKTKDGKAWYEEEELNKEEKLKKLRSAERQAAIAKRQKKQFVKKQDQGRGRKRSRWGPDFSAPAAAGAPPPADGRFGQQQLWYPPPYPPARDTSGPRCFGCDEIGHIRRNCPKKKH